jgi:hypothetical protein
MMGGDPEAVGKRVFKEDYECTPAVLQDEISFLIHLKAKVKVVAAGK